MRALRVGTGSWPAAAPFAWPFRQGMIAWPGAEVIVTDAADIDERMALHTLTIGLVSPFAYLRERERWALSPSLGLVAERPGASVALLITRHDLDLLDGTEMVVPPTAGGEPALLEALLRDRYGLVVTMVPKRGPLEALLQDYPAALVTGDRALLTATRLPANLYVHDLSDLWREVTGFPYPVALWAAQRTWAEDHPETWADAQQRLGQAKDLSLLMAEPLLEDLRARLPVPIDVLRRHLGAYGYGPGPDQAAALARFAQLAGLPAPGAL